MNCKQCGAPIPEAEEGGRCFYCGQDPTVTETQQGAAPAMREAPGARTQSSRNLALVLVAVALVAFVGAGTAGFLLVRAPADQDLPLSARGEPVVERAVQPAKPTLPPEEPAMPSEEPPDQPPLDGGALDGGTVANAASVVARMRGRFRRCHQSQLRSGQPIHGSVKLVATIEANGEVAGVSHRGDPSLEPIVPCLKA
ncbi:MAG: hypothetical protein JRI68_22310, partial [Deltaproteobacteria bacterium]|nr:hypothetical protein [Deltaproteobacteria bacterium]